MMNWGAMGGIGATLVTIWFLVILWAVVSIIILPFKLANIERILGQILEELKRKQ